MRVVRKWNKYLPYHAGADVLLQSEGRIEEHSDLHHALSNTNVHLPSLK